jgi:hypothetical protein
MKIHETIKFAQGYSPTQVHNQPLLLCGDFNARISCENDFILNDESKFTSIYEDYKTNKNILKRQSSHSNLQ